MLPHLWLHACHIQFWLHSQEEVVDTGELSCEVSNHASNLLEGQLVFHILFSFFNLY
jgi:hypothetical protein